MSVVVISRSLTEHLSDFGMTFEQLQREVAIYFSTDLSMASGIIVQAWQNGELELLIYLICEDDF